VEAEGTPLFDVPVDAEPYGAIAGAGSTGAMMFFKVKEGAQGWGTWAVTAK
jgi:hypothetical protein